MKSKRDTGPDYPMMNEEIAMREEWNLPDLTENENVLIGANGMLQTESQNLQKSTHDETEMTLADKSQKQLMNSDEALLASTSFVDDAITRLSWQMKRLAPTENVKAINLDDKDQVALANAACKTAGAMASLVKLKLNALKTFHEIKDGT